MASRMENIAGLFADVKTRTILVFTGVILLTVVMVGLLGLSRGPKKDTSTTTSIPQAPKVQSTPGVTETTPEVAKVQQQLNQQRYQKAVKTGQSTIPVDVGTTQSSGLSQSGGFIFGKNQQTDTSKKPDSAAATATTTTTAHDANSIALQKQMQTLQDKDQQLQQQQQQQQQQQIQQVTNSMQTQAQAVMAAWGGAKGTPQQEYQIRDDSDDEKAAKNAKANANAAGSTAADVKPIIKSGKVLYAVLNTAVNSDEPSPVLATIVTGSYKGAKLVGSLQDAKKIPGVRPRAVIIAFNILNIKDEDKSIKVNAVAIDPDTARTALASNVDPHYMQRYGSLFASSFLQGYGNAITQAGSVTVTNTDGGQTQFLQDLSPQQELLAGLGQVGNRWGQEVGDTFKRPNTITVDPGISIGVLFMDDVSLQQ